MLADTRYPATVTEIVQSSSSYRWPCRDICCDDADGIGDDDGGEIWKGRYGNR